MELTHVHDGVRNLHHSGLEFCKGQKLVDETQAMLLTVCSASTIRMLRVGDRSADAKIEQLGVAADRIERCPNLVTHAGQKIRAVEEEFLDRNVILPATDIA